MRRFIIVLSVASLLCACSAEKTSLRKVEVRVGTAESLSKVTVGEETSGLFPAIWQQGDCISLNGVMSQPLSASMAGGSEAAFAFTLTEHPSPCRLLYPGAATDAVNLDGKTIPMYASGSSLDEIFLFRHLCCGLRLQLVGDLSVSSLQLSAPAGENLAGKYGVSFPDGSLSAVDARSSVTLDFDAPQVLSATVPLSFFVFFAPGTFAEGLLLTAEAPDGTVRDWKIGTGCRFERGRLYLIPLTSFSASEQPGGFSLSLDAMTEELISIEL